MQRTLPLDLLQAWESIEVTVRLQTHISYLFHDSELFCLAFLDSVSTNHSSTTDDIFRTLSIIPHHDPTFPNPQDPPPTTPPYRLAFHVYKPSTTFRKSSPGPPDFQLAVVSARTNPILPTLEALGALLASTPLCPPKSEKMDRLMYMRLRHGWRNVILAVVDQGVVSFLRVADAGFGMEKLYAAKSGGTRGGKGGGRRPPGRKGRR